jgi:phosphatidylserine decarboxylase
MVPLTRHGFREMLIGTIALLVVAVGLGWAFWPLALLVLPVLIWLFAFFRDPHRTIPLEQHVMVSPADGKVSDIINIDHHELLNGPCVRVGIFLSVFNVHVNRSPCDGKVRDIKYQRGKFLNALNHSGASEQNESNTLVLVDPQTGAPVAVVKQIVGAIARRIICTVAVGDSVERGQRIGMIKFGSRTELYIPTQLKPSVKVQVGQTVRGGTDVIATLENPIHAQVSKLDDSEVEPLVGRETPA